MSELDCLNCGCGSHRGKKCSNCGTCTTWIRADHQTARAVTATNNILGQVLPPILEQLYNLTDVICEQFPEATERVKTKREELAKKQEEENGGSNTTTDSSPIEVG